MTPDQDRGEILRQKETARRALKHFSEIIENFQFLAEDQRGKSITGSKDLANSLNKLSEQLNPENLVVKSITFTARTARKDKPDEYRRYLLGEDPGVRLIIET
ncbi:hypothetical protein C4579_01320, partial [Candidatus Microgenomates bacterium]